MPVSRRTFTRTLLSFAGLNLAGRAIPSMIKQSPINSSIDISPIALLPSDLAMGQTLEESLHIWRQKLESLFLLSLNFSHDIFALSRPTCDGTRKQMKLSAQQVRSILSFMAAANSGLDAMILKQLEQPLRTTHSIPKPSSSITECSTSGSKEIASS